MLEHPGISRMLALGAPRHRSKRSCVFCGSGLGLEENEHPTQQGYKCPGCGVRAWGVVEL